MRPTLPIPPTGLPVEAALAPLTEALSSSGVAVLTAPPGAGKTTLVPLALMGAAWAAEGRILMLEPRRLAARGAAERMADLLGEKSGRRVGYRMRGESRVSAATRIEVVTEGVLTRMLQDDPELTGVAAVIFDEFHERSLHADLGLALALESRAALRPDLRICVMSATLDAAPIAALMGGAPVVASEGRAYPVETRWRDKPLARGRGAVEAAAAEAAHAALDDAGGDILIFLPGAAEIDRTARALAGVDAEILPLHGALPFARQRAALAPAARGRRKIVLATSIAETSLTVEGVRVVIDAGLARRARFDPGAGMGRLVTERASRAEADQRRGRAGRLGPGLCLRLWTRGEEAGMPRFAPPEIEISDLAPLALELANWGAAAADLAFLTPPPEGPMDAARGLLAALGALDDAGRITAHGRALAAAPTHPRLSHMILSAPEEAREEACRIAALLEDRDPMRGAGADISKRLAALRGSDRAPGLARIRADADRLARRMGATVRRPAPPGPLVARAFPDRIALHRPGGAARFLLSGGRGARMAEEDDLAAAPLLAVADLDGGGTEAAIRLAAPITREDLEALFGDRIETTETCHWSRRNRRVEARRRRMLGALALSDEAWTDADPAAIAAAMTDGVRMLGLDALPWTRPARLLAARAAWARARGADLPDLSDAGLLADLEDWLTPHLADCRKADDLARLDIAALLDARLGWDGRRALDRAAPEKLTTPAGEAVRIDYGGAAPSVSVRLQAMFGLTEHPTIGPERTPLLIELLSPAGRPVQTTADLPGFWRTSYADVRKDMRGRYPRHPWPEDPAAAAPTLRAKPRGR